MNNSPDFSSIVTALIFILVILSSIKFKDKENKRERFVYVAIGFTILFSVLVASYNYNGCLPQVFWGGGGIRPLDSICGRPALILLGATAAVGTAFIYYSWQRDS